MKLKELKHNHSLTDLLKVLIFSILMITPLLSVATRCLYVICNKNAYESYTQNTYKTLEPIYYLSNDVEDKYDYINGYVYFYSNNVNTQLESSDFRIFVDIDFFKNQYPEYENYNFTYIYIYETLSGGENRYYYYCKYTDNNNTDQTLYINLKMKPTYYVIDHIENQASIPQDFINRTENASNIFVKEYQEVTQTGTLDNVFEYSVNKLAESPILSWTQQTAIYTGVNTMTTQLGVTTPTIAMLIVYWFLLTVIYIIIDIIIKLFTWLTHIIGNKSV